MNVTVGDLHFKSQDQYNLIQAGFFPWLIEQFGDKGNNLICLGDVFSERKRLDTMILNIVPRIFDELEEHFESIIIIAGNHDVISTHSPDNINNLSTIFRHNKKIR